ncbi:MAG TPA: GIY-YIG nuclease family protein [Candidatus Paceibacterota bacterium]|nr:GIY-YIG nuclease family protein [Candidatus Paceibacterota bacterium]
MRISKWHYVYVLLSQKDEKFYIGYTKDLHKRFEQHNTKASFSTKSRTPFIMIYSEVCLNYSDATRREKYLKTTQGRRFLKLRLKEYLKLKNF